MLKAVMLFLVLVLVAACGSVDHSLPTIDQASLQVQL